MNRRFSSVLLGWCAAALIPPDLCWRPPAELVARGVCRHFLDQRLQSLPGTGIKHRYDRLLVSHDDGATWEPFRLDGLPPAPGQ